MRAGAEAAGQEDAEAGFDPAVIERAGHGDHADVVEHRLAAVGLAPGEVDLELAGQALAERIAQQVEVDGFGPCADVEHLVRAGAGQVAALHVADGVAARLATRQANRSEMFEHLGDLFELDEVHLHVLTGGDVAPAAAVALDHLGELVELVGGDRTERNPDPHHVMRAALTLAVDAVRQAEDPEHVGLDDPGKVQREHAAELVDVGPDLRVGHDWRQRRWELGDGHGVFLRSLRRRALMWLG